MQIKKACDSNKRPDLRQAGKKSAGSDAKRLRSR